MADVEAQVNKFFAAPDQSLPQDVMSELVHILQLMSLSPEDLYYKWDSYVITMGADTTKLDYKTVRDFKKTLQDALERDSRKRPEVHAAPKRVGATPRAAAAGGQDMFGILDGMVSNTPASRMSAAKRKSNFDTPTSKAVKNNMHSSPADNKTPALKSLPIVSFDDRKNAGEVVEAINIHLPAAEVPEVPSTEARIKLKAAVDLPKYSYKPMAMKLSEASEILDDRIDMFVEQVQKEHNLEDNDFGNPAAQSTSEIVAVGRIACDQPTGKLNASSINLETSRRMGAGMRVPLKLDGVTFDFFPGKIVALRGTNVSGHHFLVREVLAMPLLPPAASRIDDIDVHNDRITSADGETRPLHMILASGPYTTDTDLSFAPLYALLERAANERADALILTGPFLDLEHPVVASGDFEPHLPADAKIEPDQATLTDVFRILIGTHVQRLAQAVPTISIIMVPSMRDAVSKHVSWPQDRVPKPQLGLPKQVQFVANPMALFLNEMIFGMSSQDVLSELHRGGVAQSAGGDKPLNSDLLARLSEHIIEQSHYFPVFPPQSREELPKPAAIPDEVPEPGGEERLALGANIDLSYYKLGEFWQARPDVLILPSTLMPFARFVQGVLCINPGTLSRKRGAGTFASVDISPRTLSDEEREAGDYVGHKLHERARIEIKRI
ncbi:putative DNA polymerase alpha/delta/epsilon, subunit B, DNA polymerase alpha, subunit B [Septoria linicola]|nr:putative DNA polymerase alpha/delta/epsilon, subunit B, DNA polymerase alpha, subunit B [Septoria linicola]